MASLSSGWDSLTAFRRVSVFVIFVMTSVFSSLVVVVVQGVFLNTILDQLTALEKIARWS